MTVLGGLRKISSLLYTVAHPMVYEGRRVVSKVVLSSLCRAETFCSCLSIHSFLPYLVPYLILFPLFLSAFRDIHTHVFPSGSFALVSCLHFGIIFLGTMGVPFLWCVV